jgi:hypothetical protein
MVLVAFAQSGSYTEFEFFFNVPPPPLTQKTKIGLGVIEKSLVQY